MSSEKHRNLQAVPASPVTASDILSPQNSDDTRDIGDAERPSDTSPRLTVPQGISIVAAALFYGVCCLAYGMFGLNVLEFVRHTEADRTLIAWEMLSQGKLLIPYLLHDPYPTKPPLFYGAMRTILSVAGSTEPWAARLISPLAGSLLVASHALFCGIVIRNRSFAALSTTMLMTTIFFFQYLTLAEIDMMFTALCGCTLYLGYLACATVRYPRLLAAVTGLLAGCAFLTKGPQVLAFLGFSCLGFSYYRFREAEFRRSFIPFVRSRLFWGASVCLAMIGVWLFLLVENFPAGELKELFYKEVVLRFLNDPKADVRSRSVFFYWYTIPLGLMPWAPCLLGFFVRDRKGGAAAESNSCMPRALLYYALWGIFGSLILFSCASGKSSRYLFPIFPLFALLTAEGGRLLVTSHRARDQVFRGYDLLCYVSFGAIVCIVAYATIFLSLDRALGNAVFLSAVLWLLFRFRRQATPAAVTLGVALFVFAARVPFTTVIAPIKNTHSSVRPVAREIKDTLPGTPRLYIVELFERWLVYYLKADFGFDIYRLSPSEALKLQTDTELPEKTYLLLNSIDERWRLAHLATLDSSLSLIRTLRTSRQPFYLVSVTNDALTGLHLEKLFPTTPSPPFERGYGWTPLS